MSEQWSIPVSKCLLFQLQSAGLPAVSLSVRLSGCLPSNFPSACRGRRLILEAGWQVTASAATASESESSRFHIDWNQQQVEGSLAINLFFLQNWFLCGQISHFHMSPNQYYTREWLLCNRIGTFLHSLLSCIPNTDFPLRSRKAVWHYLLESVGILNKCLMACAQQYTPKPGRMWQITNVSRPAPLCCPADKKYFCLHLFWAE